MKNSEILGDLYYKLKILQEGKDKAIDRKEKLEEQYKDVDSLKIIKSMIDRTEAIVRLKDYKNIPRDIKRLRKGYRYLLYFCIIMIMILSIAALNPILTSILFIFPTCAAFVSVATMEKVVDLRKTLKNNSLESKQKEIEQIEKEIDNYDKELESIAKDINVADIEINNIDEMINEILSVVKNNKPAMAKLAINKINSINNEELTDVILEKKQKVKYKIK